MPDQPEALIRSLPARLTLRVGCANLPSGYLAAWLAAAKFEGNIVHRPEFARAKGG
jgi:hypothetical protein